MQIKKTVCLCVSCVWFGVHGITFLCMHITSHFSYNIFFFQYFTISIIRLFLLFQGFFLLFTNFKSNASIDKRCLFFCYLDGESIWRCMLEFFYFLYPYFLLILFKQTILQYSAYQSFTIFKKFHFFLLFFFFRLIVCICLLDRFACKYSGVR